MKKEEIDEQPKRKWYLNIIMAIVGLAGIIFGGDLVVDNASTDGAPEAIKEKLESQEKNVNDR